MDNFATLVIICKNFQQYNELNTRKRSFFSLSMLDVPSQDALEIG